MEMNDGEGCIYVRPVDRFTPARKAETVKENKESQFSHSNILIHDRLFSRHEFFIITARGGGKKDILSTASKA